MMLPFFGSTSQLARSIQLYAARIIMSAVYACSMYDDLELSIRSITSVEALFALRVKFSCRRGAVLNRWEASNR